MNLKNQRKTFLTIFLWIFLLGQGCIANASTVPSQAAPTVKVTATRPAIRTAYPTVATTSTPDEAATVHAIETASIQTLISTVQPEVLEKTPSSDGNWLAEVVRYDCMNFQYLNYAQRVAYEQLVLVNLNDRTEKILEDQFQNCDGIGGGGLKALYWSTNSSYFYYTDWREGHPEGCGNYLMPTIYRYDTLTQESITVGGGHISPDQTKLALWEWQKPEIVIWDLDQGEVARVQSLHPLRFHGEISWAPDSQSIVYLQTEWDCAPDYGKTSLTRLNLAGLSQELLLERESPGFGRVHWGTVDQLILWDGDNREWLFDIPRRELKASLSMTTTPLPSPTGQFNLSQMTVTEWSSTSADGKWTAVGLVAFPKENIGGQFAYVRLLIFSTDGMVHWTIVDEWQETGLGFPMPWPLKWSQDGHRFYFTHRVIPDGCSAFPFFTNLQQVNLADGTVTEMLPQPAVTLALVPDESKVAYVRPGSQELILKDLVHGKEREIKIDPGKDFQAGNTLWSPDGGAVTLTLAINPCTGEFGVSKTVWAESTTILWVDAETLQQKVLIEEDPRWFITWEWNQPEKITIVDGVEDSLWKLDVNTGEITRE